MLLEIFLGVGNLVGFAGMGIFGFLCLKLRGKLYNLAIEKKPLTITEEKIVYKEIEVAAKAPKLLAAHPHDLDKVWWRNAQGSYGYNSYVAKGWYYKCTCGAFSRAVTKNDTSKSTEASAVSAWKAHRELYKDLPYSTTEEHNHLAEELNEARRKLATCFCHDLQEPEKKEVKA